ncbi:hypothetical protein ACOI22_03495 [Glaciecola sp. 2405UD65-10]|uniref:hypothetical protein n=1 Tax=Glaciecola sp. 2405UD65-10 TaxID=3397244 RepID=UPI003B5A209F
MIIPMAPGTESLARIKLLLSLGKFNQNTEDALCRYFVNGMDVEGCCFIYDIRQPNLVRSIKRLNEINDTVQRIKDLDLYHLTDLTSQQQGVTQ